MLKNYRIGDDKFHQWKQNSHHCVIYYAFHIVSELVLVRRYSFGPPEVVDERKCKPPCYTNLLKESQLCDWNWHHLN